MIYPNQINLDNDNGKVGVEIREEFLEVLEMMKNKCPCGSKKIAEQCCSLIIHGKKIAETPEQLMRSRYTAYTQANIDYIQKTMAGSAAKNFDAAAAKIWAESVIWLGLIVKRAFLDQQNPNKGFVEFEASFKNGADKVQKICELSEFTKIDHRWFYTNGTNSTKSSNSVYNTTGRNDPCICGSGKKFKKCCQKQV